MLGRLEAAERHALYTLLDRLEEVPCCAGQG